ncbi:TcfC E-set like domain-containing protein [Aeromonas salmonicida]|uniref:TcfC E-set like domain-containing protein n=1 Tax=Aeromonas salmonicida TaxID=645 RepID=UPI003F7B3BF3
MKYIFYVFIPLLISINVNSQEKWIPDEFKNLMQERTQLLDIYYGDIWLTKSQVKSRVGAIRLLEISRIVDKINGIEPNMQDELQALLDDWLPSHVNQQCYYDDIRACEPSKFDAPSVILDEARLRLRLSLPHKYLARNMDGIGKSNIHIPESDQKKLTMVQGVDLAFSGDKDYINYNLVGNTAIGLREYNLRGLWGYSESNNKRELDAKQLAVNHESKGFYWSTGLLDSSYPSIWNAFRAIPSANFLGFQIATSANTLLDKSKSSASPLSVYLPSSGRVEIYRENKLLLSQMAPVGISQLNTDTLPYGVYEVELRGFVGTTQVFTERQIFVRSSWLPSRSGGDFGFNFGVMSHTSTQEGTPIGGIAWSKSISDSLAIKTGGLIRNDWQRVEVGVLGVWPFNYNISFIADNDWLGTEVVTSARFKNLSGAIEMRRYMRLDSLDAPPTINTPKKSLTARLSYEVHPGHHFSYRYNYREQDDLYSFTKKTSTKYINRGADYGFRLPLYGKYYMNAVVGVGMSNNSDDLAYINFSFMYSDKYQAAIGQEFRNQGAMKDTQSDLSISWSKGDDIFFEKSNYNISASHSENKNGLGLGMNFESDKSAGSIIIQSLSNSDTNHSSINTFGSVKTQIASDENGNLGWGKGTLSNSTGIIVDLTSSPDIGIMHLLVNNSNYPVYPGRKNWIPLKPFNTYHVRLRDNVEKDKLVNVKGLGGTLTLYPGNVIYLAYQIEEDEVIFGLLKGKSFHNASVMGRFPASIDSAGQFQVRVPRGTQQLLIKNIDNELCIASLPEREGALSIRSVGVLECKKISIEQANKSMMELNFDENTYNLFTEMDASIDV